MLCSQAMGLAVSPAAASFGQGFFGGQWLHPARFFRHLPLRKPTCTKRENLQSQMDLQGV